ncbi:MAG: hypothetical protein DMG05_07320 [Acidobacteria bacterium]|nr:MAG: hypothetical protein DMG05_07320 [Acidobacteriota bacterium]
MSPMYLLFLDFEISPKLLELLGGEEVQTLVKFVNLPPPHSGTFLKAPMTLPLGEGGRRTGEGSVADRAALLGGLSSVLP